MVSSAILPLCKDNTYRTNYKNSRSCKERDRNGRKLSARRRHLSSVCRGTMIFEKPRAEIGPRKRRKTEALFV